MLRKALINFTSNTTGTVVRMISGFLVMPYLITHLGNETYGLWTLIGSMTGYFNVFDLGVSGSVGRLIAFHRARLDVDQVNRVMSTALAILLGVFVLACIATFGMQYLFFQLFDVSTAQAHDVRMALLIVGANLALTAPTSVFYGLIWGYERFDSQSAVDIFGAVARTALTFLLISSHSTLTQLAWIVIGVNVVGVLLRALIAYRLEPRLKFAPWRADRETARSLYSFGIWLFLISLSKSLIPQVGPAVIGHRLGAAPVTTFTIAKQTETYISWLLIAATQVLAPKAVALHATERVDAQRRLFLIGGQFATALAVLAVSGLVIFGHPFLMLWQGPAQDAAYPLLVVLLLGEWLPMTQWITYSTIVGKGEHRSLAYLSIMEGIVTLVVTLLMTREWGLMGACVAVSLSAILFRGFGQCLLGCRIVGISFSGYCSQVFWPVLVVAVVPLAVFIFIGHRYPPSSWLSLFLLSTAYTAVFALVVGIKLIGLGNLKQLLARARLRK